MGYRTDVTRPATGVATGDEPETIYMVTSGRHYNGGCCFNYGNAEIDPLFGHSYGRGNMEAIYWGCGNVSFVPFYTSNRIFAKTGSGQTWKS